MFRRGLCFAVSGMCLLSFVASLAAGWMWRRSHRVYEDGLRIDTGSWSVTLDSWPTGLGVGLDAGWSAPPGIRRWSHATLADQMTDWVLADGGGTFREMRWFGAEINFARCRILLNPDHVRAVSVEEAFPGGQSGPDPSDLSPTVVGRSIRVPHWWVVAATSLPPVLWAGVRTCRLAQRRRRRRLGLCLRCGYDLRGSTASVRCSERGEPVARRAAAAAEAAA